MLVPGRPTSADEGIYSANDWGLRKATRRATGGGIATSNGCVTKSGNVDPGEGRAVFGRGWPRRIRDSNLGKPCRPVEIRSDASAAARSWKGAGTAKHLRIREVWIPDALEAGDLYLLRSPTTRLRRKLSPTT